jgi:hypothetical protein
VIKRVHRSKHASQLFKKAVTVQRSKGISHRKNAERAESSIAGKERQIRNVRLPKVRAPVTNCKKCVIPPLGEVREVARLLHPVSIVVSVVVVLFNFEF